MNNNNYYGSSTDQYEHYKVKYHNGNACTGGFFQGRANAGSALFGTPMVNAPHCDNTYPSLCACINYEPSDFNLTTHPFLDSSPYSSFHSIEYPTYSTDCLPFKDEAPDTELVMPFEDESEIITYYDRITVKDTPENTRYQIYSITGQLLQIGATGTDISTAQLSKGIYILRLENGKVVKFVK
jgi:hypothetical protein